MRKKKMGSSCLIPWLTRSIVIVPVILFFANIGFTRSIGPPFHQRCFSEIATTNVSLYKSPGWLESSCRPCKEPFRRSTVNLTSRQLHVAIQLTTPKLQPEFLSIAAGLLAENVNVTLFYMNFDRSTTDDFSNILWNGVLAGTPCRQDAFEHLRPTLSIQAINIPPSVREMCSQRLGKGSFYADPIQSCSVIAATNQYRAHTNAFLRADGADIKLTMPDVLLSDIHGFGALLFAEKLGIPSIILADETIFYDSIGSAEKDISIGQYIKSIPGAFFNSFFSTKTFSDLNRMRGVLELKPKRQLSGFWDLVTSVFVIANRYNSHSLPEQRGHYPPLMHLTTPILSPCMTCTEHPATRQQKEQLDRLVVIVFPPEDFTQPQAREVLRGLHVARKSIQSTTTGDACSKGGTSKICWPDPVDLQVKWMLHMDASSHIYFKANPLPSFVEEQDATLYLDSALQSFKSTTSKDKTILLASCDSDARDSLLLRIPTLCLPSKQGVKQTRMEESSEAFRTLENLESLEIAAQLVRFLHTLRNLPQEEVNMPHHDDNEADSLQRTVAAIRTAGSLLDDTGMLASSYHFAGDKASQHRKNLQGSFVSAMRTKGVRLAPLYQPSLSFADSLRYWKACIILFLACCYAAVKRIFPGAARHLRVPLRNVRHHQVKLFWEALIMRLPEVDNGLSELFGLWKDRENLRRPASKGDSTNGRQNGRVQAKSSGNKSNNAPHKKRIGKHR